MSALRLTGPILESKGISAIFQKKGKIFENLGKNVNGQLHACDCRMHQTARICPRLILKDKGGKQHCLRLVGSNLGIEIFLKKKGTSIKGRVEIEDSGASVHFALGFQENSM